MNPRTCERCGKTAQTFFVPEVDLQVCETCEQELKDGEPVEQNVEQTKLLAIIDKMKAWVPDEHDVENALREWEEYVAYGIRCFEFMLQLES